MQTIQQNIAGAVRARLSSKIGYITSYDPKNYSVRVRLEPESTANEVTGVSNPVVETGWIPLLRTYGGDGWGDMSPPKASATPPYGDACVVLFPDGGSGVALAGLFTDRERTIQASTSFPSGDSIQATGGEPKWGERWIVHPKGGFVKLLNDGSISIHDKNNSLVLLDGSGQVFVSSSSGDQIQMSGSGAIVVQAGGTTGSIKLLDKVGSQVFLDGAGVILVQNSGGGKITITGANVQIN